MKKMICFLLCLLCVCMAVTPAWAAGAEIVFTSDSSFNVGGTVTVDKGETLLSVYNYGTSDTYNAYLEGDVQYFWMRNDSYYADGPSLTLKEEDRGCEFYCIAALYSDADHTQQCGTLYSKTFTVPGGEPATIPEITTKELPDGTVGEDYYQRLTCSDPDVVYSLFRSSLPDGLYLTQHGEIEGIPEKAGFWHVVIMVTPEAGEAYAATAEFEITIHEPGPQYALEILEVPDKVTYISGEKLDMKGLWVRIYTPDGFIDSRDGKYLTYSQNALVTLGEQKIKLSYEDAMEFFIVTVVAAPTEPTQKPTEPAQKPTDPTQAATEPAQTTTNPQGTVKPTEKPVNPFKPDNNKNNGKTEVKQEDSAMSPLAMIGIAVGVIAAINVIAIAIFLLTRRKR